MIIGFNKKAAEGVMINGELVILPPAEFWAHTGTRLGGGVIETAFPGIEQWAQRALSAEDVPGFMAKIRHPVQSAATIAARLFERSNVSFGAFGDWMRLEFNQLLLVDELSKGKTFKELYDAKVMHEISTIGNNITGWSDTRFGGDVGNFALFAARFFQARLDTYGQAILGLSRVRLPEREALRSWRETKFNVPIKGRHLVESPVLSSMGREQTIKSRQAMRSVLRMIGLVTMFTEAINLAGGHETDRRPWVNGRPNPNFYRGRLWGQDFNFFGPSLGLASFFSHILSGHPDRAIRSLGGAWVRILADAITGYTVIGEKSFGTAFGDRDVKRMAVYISEFMSPIASEQLTGQAISIIRQVPSALEGKEGATERILGGIVGGGAELIGVGAQELSLGDWKDKIALELPPRPGKSPSRYAELPGYLKRRVDKLAEAAYGKEVTHKGKEGPWRTKVDKSDATLVDSANDIAQKFLLAPIFSDDYNPVQARKEVNEAKKKHRRDVWGSWDKDKQRVAGGYYENIYDMDEEREEPKDRGTVEHLLWEYGETFRLATDPKGNIDQEELEKLQSIFWAKLTTDPETGIHQVDQLLGEIRLLENDFHPAAQKMYDAGRYAGGLKLTVSGENLSFYQLEDHHLVWDHLRTSGAPDSTIAEFMDAPSWQRSVFSGSRERPDMVRIGTAWGFARSLDGILTELQDEFLALTPEHPDYGSYWGWAMMEAGYRYPKKNLIEGNMKDQAMAGSSMPEIDYRALYRQVLIDK